MDKSLAELATYFGSKSRIPDQDLVRLTAAARAAGSRWETGRLLRPARPRTLHIFSATTMSVWLRAVVDWPSQALARHSGRTSSAPDNGPSPPR